MGAGKWTQALLQAQHVLLMAELCLQPQFILILKLCTMHTSVHRTPVDYRKGH